MKKLLKSIVLSLFDNTNITTDTGLSDEMKTYYNTQLIRTAEPELIHNQFGQKRPIPKNGGKVIEFRKYDSLPKISKPLSEGVTPNGQKMNVTKFNATVKQYGGYVELSDILQLTAVDNNLQEATTMIASQAGRTLDTLTRDIINSGTNVQFGDGTAKTSRGLLVGGEADGNDYLTVKAIKRAVRNLKIANAPRKNGYYIGIIHPDIANDLTDDNDWKYPHQYVDTKEIYNGELGAIAGVRFVEATETKVFHAPDLASDARTLSVNGAVSASKNIPFDGGSVSVDELKGRFILVGNILCEVASNTASVITVKENVSCSDNTVIYPGEAGAKGRDVYSTLILGDNAYGVTEIEGGGLKHIVKPNGSAGTADPLDQRATVGWKALHAAEILVQQYIERVETCSTFELGYSN